MATSWCSNIDCTRLPPTLMPEGRETMDLMYGRSKIRAHRTDWQAFCVGLLVGCCYEQASTVWTTRGGH